MARRPATRRKPKVPILNWTLIARVKHDRAEIVKVPIDPDAPDAPKEEVIKTMRRPRSRHRLDIIGDSTGQAALKAFRLAVREAKRQ